MNILGRRGLSILWTSLCLAALARGQSPAPPATSTEPDADQGTPVAVSAPIQERQLLVPLAIGHDRVLQLQARLCLPSSAVPATLVLINHGSPPQASDRPKMQLGRCDQEAAQWFLSRGYVVAFVLRRGYGETGGEWGEDYFGCGHPDFVHAGPETAIDLDAAVDFLTRLPELKPGDAIVLGQSAGGWGTIGYSSVQHPKVAHSHPPAAWPTSNNQDRMAPMVTGCSSGRAARRSGGRSSITIS